MAFSRPEGPAGPAEPSTDVPGWAVPSHVMTPDRPRRRRLTGWAVAVIVLALVAAAMFVRVPYAILSPGPVVNTLGKGADGKPLIGVGKHATYPTTGELDFTTVAVRGGPGYPVTLVDVLRAELDGSEVLPVDQVFPRNATATQVKEQGTAEMRSSQQAATVVALRHLGITVPEKAAVAAIPEGSPALGHLRADDVIQRIDSTPVTSTGQARDLVRKHRGGDVIVLDVLRGGVPVTAKVTAAEKDGQTAIGIYLAPSYTFPVDVTVSAGDVGGPSAGTMFALGIYDTLTPGALTGGRKIAGTGALDPDGTVEPIGGIAEKMTAARHAGADYFLAPAANCSDVVGHVPDGLHVTKITSFDDAVKAVTAIGEGASASLPTCG